MSDLEHKMPAIVRGPGFVALGNISSDMHILMWLVSKLPPGQVVVRITQREIAEAAKCSQTNVSRFMKKMTALDIAMSVGYVGIAINPSFIYRGDSSDLRKMTELFREEKARRDQWLGQRRATIARKKALDRMDKVEMKSSGFDPFEDDEPAPVAAPVEDDDWILAPGEPREYDGP